MKVEALAPPLSINRVRDGGIYHKPAAPFTQTNLFLNVACVDDLYIKTPSERGMGDYRIFINQAQSSALDIRSLEPAERIENLGGTLASLPELKPFTAISTEIAHYLAVHKLQYERLRGQTAVRIPHARFGALCTTHHRVLRRFEPALFQERVQGTTLWSMFDFQANQVLAKWRPLLPEISARLSGLLGSGLIDHVDWNIQNFVWEESNKRLNYVDLKPTTFVSRHSNEMNLKGIGDYFLA